MFRPRPPAAHIRHRRLRQHRRLSGLITHHLSLPPAVRSPPRSIQAAHAAALTELGGWFLLKYASRDEIVLLGLGTGGIVEIRNNIAQHEDVSPLFGFLRYRRRSVVIKYIPEECSRLVQARCTVHFTLVCDRFAPYNTTFSISHSAELKDSKLSAAYADNTESKRGVVIQPIGINLDLAEQYKRQIVGTPSVGLASPLATPASSRSPTWPPSVHHNSTNLRLTRRVSMSMSSRRSSAEQKSPALLSVASPSGSSGLPLVPSDLSGDSDGESHTGGQSRSASASASPAGHNSGSSRAQRFIRRLSNSLNTSRKNYMPAISPTVAEGDVVEEDVAEEEAALAARHGPVNGACGGPIVAYMGDVNVQFPDSLLWKRRTLCLDSLGFLVLSTNQSSTAMSITLDGTASRSVGVKRYHMSEFRMPYTPEIEVEELPFSVVLNLVGGGELQVACDDKAGQLNVLHTLEDAHQGPNGFVRAFSKSSACRP
ncbi:hypothetical protein P8C59_004598 [Phyllachora maydis]|uniref:Uncharacterized protein n=1 Tax=Phyllachora maydis TaxID=1825666 RepID=A0AAD9MEK5_9PEZI|nr:hypothetical protein P8C59_004598 [Phyllachora maydis]